MTFEEFFAKKKIDLVQLEKADQVLYNEFKSHFSSMGEKSFDHTKKFWFNRLRRLYHLKLPEKAVTQVETAIASQAEPLSSPTIEQKPAFTPRFKSANINKSTAAEEQSAKPLAKPAFKPRNIPVKNIEMSADSQDEKAESTPSVKPGFRPRNIKQIEIKSEEANVPEETKEERSEESKSVVRKPGFKPRNIKPAPDTNSADAQTSDSRPGQQGISETPVSNPEEQKDTEKKEAYKAKFKLKNIPKNLEEKQSVEPGAEEVAQASTQDHAEQAKGPDIERKISSSTENKTPEQEIQDTDIDLRGGDDASVNEKPKPAYKPKFNLKNIKPKSGE